MRKIMTTTTTSPMRKASVKETEEEDEGESQEQISFVSGMKEVVRVMVMRMKPGSITPVFPVSVIHAYTYNHEDNDDNLSNEGGNDKTARMREIMMSMVKNEGVKMLRTPA